MGVESNTFVPVAQYDRLSAEPHVSDASGLFFMPHILLCLTYVRSSLSVSARDGTYAELTEHRHCRTATGCTERRWTVLAYFALANKANKGDLRSHFRAFQCQAQSA